ncbi:MAG: response regulator [Rhodospirillales bacterium]|nr:response regulator [Rhodospirillales bacterium]
MDPGRFDQVIVNLAVNARDAMRGSGRLSLSTQGVSFATPTQLGEVMMPAGPFVQVEMRDTGTGIPKEIIDDIFQPFFTTKPLGEGTGLGLATVYGIIRQSGGYIGVDSALGSGATFRILLPAAEPAMEPAENSAPASISTWIETRPPQGRSTRAASILLVEDDEAVRRFAARALRGRGWTVTEAADGESALRAMAGNVPFDVLLSDMTLPDIHGSVVVEQARRGQSRLKVVVISADISAWAEEEMDRRVSRLSKPFSWQNLLRASSVSSSRRNSRRARRYCPVNPAPASPPPDPTLGSG